MSLSTHLAACSILLLSGPLSRATDGTPFAEVFRISHANESRILNLTPEGWLVWSNASPGAAYVVERTHNPGVTPWKPFFRNVATNLTPAIQIADPSPPEGMVFLPGGQFVMGDAFGEHSTAQPLHTVTLSAFFMQRHELSNGEAQSVLQWALAHRHITVTDRGVEPLNASTNVLLPLGRFAQEITYANGTFGVRSGRERYPLAYITWFGAAALCNYLSLREGLEPCYDLALWTCDFQRSGYRLPTEAEWEYAARGAHHGRRFSWGDSDEITHSRANYQSRTNRTYDVSPTRGLHPDYGSSRPSSSPVGAFPPNSFGLYDMTGNVWEWVWDWWGGRYPNGDAFDPTGASPDRLRIFRGGSWLTTSERVTCAIRYPDQPHDSIQDVGLRLVRRVAAAPAAPQP